MSVVGFKIKKLRENKKITQPELANILQISQTKLSNIENGKTDSIDFLLMHKISNYFEKDYDYFADESKIYNITNNNGVAGDNYGTVHNMPENFDDIIHRIMNNMKNVLVEELDRLKK